MDSGLEAFSHYPTDGSFMALSDQTTAFTNYLPFQELAKRRKWDDSLWGGEMECWRVRQC